MKWPQGEKATATCMRGRVHDAPAPNCGCGIYAAHIEEASRYYAPDRVMIQVALWGTTHIHWTGARGQFAYPQKILVYPDKPTNHRMARLVAELYGIPVSIETPDPVAIRRGLRQGQ